MDATGARTTAFASDFDGTLCQSNWETGEVRFDPAVLEAVRRYRAAGGLFGICTGRPYFSIRQTLAGIVDLDFYIVTTGAQVLDRDGRPLIDKPIDPVIAKELCDRYAQEGMGFLAVTDTDFYAVGASFSLQMPTVRSLDEVPGRLLGVSLEYHGDEVRARIVRDELNERYGQSVQGFQNLGSVDVVARGCSKGSGVSVLRDAYGVTCIAGAGDSYNDLPLLAAADVSYTFDASPAEVRAAASYVVQDLAEALDHFMALM